NMGGTLHLAASQNQKLTNGLVGLWSFDQADVAGTTAYDRSGQGNNGTFTHGEIVTAGKIGQAMAFVSAANESVDTANITQMNGASQLTMSMWFRRSVVNGDVQISKISAGTNQISVEASTDGQVYLFPSSNATGYAQFTSNDTAWHHVVMVFDGTKSGTA